MSAKLDDPTTTCLTGGLCNILLLRETCEAGMSEESDWFCFFFPLLLLLPLVPVAEEQDSMEGYKCVSSWCYA
jgi:hypothetical protein